MNAIADGIQTTREQLSWTVLSCLAIREEEKPFEAAKAEGLRDALGELSIRSRTEREEDADGWVWYRVKVSREDRKQADAMAKAYKMGLLIGWNWKDA